jgi:hypothetical protein
MAKKKVTSRPRCICGAYADLMYMPGQRSLGKPVFTDLACRKCTGLALDANMVPGGCLKFVDQLEVEWVVYEVDEAEAEAAVYTERCRRIEVEGEVHLMAIFKIQYEHGWEWYAQPIPYEAQDG